MLDLAGIFQGGVHITVTVCVRDALDGLRRSLPQSDGGPHPFDDKHLIFLTGTLPLLLGFVPLCDALLEQPKTKGSNGGGEAQQRDQAPDRKLNDHDVPLLIR